MDLVVAAFQSAFSDFLNTFAASVVDWLTAFLEGLVDVLLNLDVSG